MTTCEVGVVIPIWGQEKFRGEVICPRLPNGRDCVRDLIVSASSVCAVTHPQGHLTSSPAVEGHLITVLMVTSGLTCCLRGLASSSPTGVKEAGGEGHTVP